MQQANTTAADAEMPDGMIAANAVKQLRALTAGVAAAPAPAPARALAAAPAAATAATSSPWFLAVVRLY